MIYGKYEVTTLDEQAYKQAINGAIKKIGDLTKKLETYESHNEIAIIGYDCVFPGGANSPGEYWSMLSEGRDAVRRLTDERFAASRFYSENGGSGKMATCYASLIDKDIKEFDHVHFELSEKEAVSTDPQHRLLLETSYKALQNAGISAESIRGKKVGVFIGAESFDYAQSEFVSGNTEDITPYTLFGVMPTSAAGRISYYYDFRGPAVTCDTACSSSLTALNSAVESLRSGQCSIALVGGVNLILGPEAFIGLSQINSLAKDGRCKTFDKKADGFGRGEGCGVLVLKRSEDAKRDEDHIEAVIKGISVGQDGKSNGFYAPNGLAEQAVIQQAIENSGLDVNEIDYVETHGTGTVLGDSIEAQALSAAYKKKQKKLMIGSVKTNVGHLEAAAGMASIIKVLLAMKNHKIPPSLNCDELNPNINWDHLDVVRKLSDWEPEDHKRCAAVSCFGITGSLAHVILQEYPYEKAAQKQYMPSHLITLSVKRKSALKKAVSDFCTFAEKNDNDYRDLCYTTNIQRSYEEYRYTAVADSKEKLISQMKESLNDEKVYDLHTGKAKKDKKKVAFLFTGQGSIYPHIAKQFYESSKEYRECFDQCDVLFKNEMGYSIKEAVFSDDTDLTVPKYSQPIIFAVEYSLTKVWESTGINADMVIGHSIGEYAAASYAGLMELEDIVRMIALRARLMETVEPNGKMVGVLTSEADVLEAISESGCKNVSVAAINTPNNVTVSGLADEVDQVIKCLQKKKKVFVNNLGIKHAFHSVVVKPYAEKYEEELSTVSFRKLTKPMISSVTGKKADEAVLGNGKYWAQHLCNPVRFADAVQTAKDQGVYILIEIGGTATLSGIAEQNIKEEGYIFVPTLRKGVPEYQQFLLSLSELYRAGVQIDWKSFYRNYTYESVQLCEYPFMKKQVWSFKKDRVQVNGNENVPEKNERMMRKKTMAYETKNTVALVLDDIIGTVHALTGIDKDDIDPNRELVSYGFDSLLLASLGKQLETKYGLVVSMDKLFTSLNTLERISEHIVENCDISSVVPDSEDYVSESIDSDDEYEEYIEPDYNFNAEIKEDPHQLITENVPAGEINITGFSRQLFESQISLLREQNEIIMQLLSGNTVNTRKMVPAAGTNTENNKKNKAAAKQTDAPAISESVNKNKEYYVPYKKMSLVETEKMEALQLQYLKNIEKKVTALTAKSKKQTQDYRAVYASNRNSAGFRPLYKEMLYQIIAQSGHGAHMQDIDGNDYIDITMGFGVDLFGHCPAFVEDALKDELKNGIPVGPMGRLAGVVANQIHELTGVERVFFCNSGTEADMFAVRIARAITGKKKIVAFTGSFHGTYDGLLGVPSLKNDIDQMTLPMAPGISENSVRDLILLDFNSDSSIKFIEEHSDIIAGVITEPVQSRRPDVWPRDFLKKLREVTKRNNIAFILDEIITGFRIGAGGAQEFFDIDADIVTYGKVIGGGMPIGIVSGKAKYMDSIDGGMWQFGDNSVPPCDERRTFVAGTFCHHPLAMASCNAVLNYIAENKDKIYPELNQKTQAFADDMNSFFEEENVPVKVVNFASLFRFQIAKDKEIFYYGLLEKGVYVWEGRNCFFSTEHSEEDVERLKNAVKNTILEMKEAGYFGSFFPPSGGKDQKKKMSVIQQRLVSQMLITESDPYDIISSYYADDSLDVQKVEKVVKKIIERHDILHTALYLEDGEYIQKVVSDWSFHVRLLNSDTHESINELISSSVTKFDLKHPPLIEVVLVNSTDFGKVLIFHFHHTVADGISMDIFVKEFQKLYDGKEIRSLEHQYSDYTDWETEYYASEQLKKDRDFWVESVGGTSFSPILPYDNIGAKYKKFASNTILKVIDKELLAKLKKLAQNNNCTLFMLLMAILDVVIHKHNGEEEISVFSPSSTRFDGGFEQNIGMFTNSIVINNTVDKSLRFVDFLKGVKQNLIESYQHSNYPFHLLLSDLNVSGQDGFKVGFVYENVSGRDAEQLNIRLKTIDYVPVEQFEDLTFELLENEGEINAYLRYRRDLYLDSTIELIGERMLHIMREITAHPDAQIVSLHILLPEEESAILGRFNATQTPYDTSMTMVDVFEKQCERTPDKTAVIFGDQEITYREMNYRINSVAARLRDLGIKPNDFVAVLAQRGIEMNIAVLGVVKSGAAYVNIDPDFPENRIRFMLEDCAPKAIVTFGADNLYSFPEVKVEPLSVPVEKIDNLPVVNTADDILYCMYTSGTTGTPKGILITHRNVNADILHYLTSFHLDENTVSLQYGNYTFDIFTEETYPSYAVGATLVMISKDLLLNTEKAVEYLNSKKVNLVHTTPLILSEFNNVNKLKYAKTFVVGGDVLLPEHISNLLQSDAEIFQDYGPTENTVIATVYQIKKADEKIDYRTFNGKIPIGHPKCNTQVYIERDDALCGIGIPGELLIAGDGLTKGYLNRDELTKEKIVKNPYGAGRVYHSGDLARWLPDGNIEFLGRIDDQVKIRGQRVELREIENNLCMLPEVKEAVVLAKDNDKNEKEIHAYLVLNIKKTMSEIKTDLREFLPDYMIPTYMMSIDALPVTRNGKVDKKALPEIEKVSDVKYVAPKNEAEKTVADLFAEILEVNQVGANDSFFDLGGHSLKATKLVNKLERAFGKRISVKDVFRLQTVDKIAGFMEGLETGTQTIAFEKAEKRDYYPMSSTQKRMYLIWQLDKNGISYNMPGIYKIKGIFDTKRLKNALEQVIERHEIYRTRFRVLNGETVQFIEDKANIDFTVIHHHGSVDIEKLMSDFVRPFDLENDVLIRIRVIVCGDESYLLIDTHHIVSDGTSIQLFTKEMCELYNGGTLKPLTYQYKDYSEWMLARDLSSQKEFWVDEYSEEIPVLDIFTDYPRGTEQNFDGNTVFGEIDSVLSEKIALLSEKTGATAFMILMSALMVLLQKYSRSEDVVVGTPISGRMNEYTESMMGMFVNTLAVHGKPENNKKYSDFLNEIQEFCLKAYDNQEYPFEELVDELDIQRDVSRNPLFDVMFALQNLKKEAIRLDEATVEECDYSLGISKFDMTFDISETDDDTYVISLEYASALFRQESMENMLKQYLSIISQIADTPDMLISDIEAVTTEEKRIIMEQFNDTAVDYPKNKTISQLFSETVKKYRNKNALCYEGEWITYDQLDVLASKVAVRLIKAGVRPNDRVAVIAKKSLEVVIGICGIIRAGAAYVPIDPSYPEERIWFILEDSQPKVVLLYENSISIDQPSIDLKECLNDPATNQLPEVENKPEDLAYIIYTSGTTGKPKGVMVTNRNVVKLVKNCDYVPLDENSVILQTGQLAFDASTFELWGAFLNGGQMHLISEETLLDVDAFRKYIRSHNINTMFITTALFNQLISCDITIFDSLKYLLFGGEATSEKHVHMLKEHNQKLELSNVYGPTETTTFATYYLIKEALPKTPIGKPISNTGAYVMMNGRMCGFGVPGELCIVGDGVSDGYLNRAELTEEKFVDNPFGSGKMYRSGDLVRWLPDGNIEYLGRIDEQVKIHGFRIELQEIENAIVKIDSIKDCACVVKEQDGDKYLCTYLVTDQEIPVNEIKSQLSKSLPHYMVPNYMMYIDSLPMNSNGKVDMRRLPEITISSSIQYVAPTNKKESDLCEMVQSVLGVKMVGIADNYFDLGGDSLKAIRIITGLRERGWSLTVQNILLHQVIGDIADVMRETNQNDEVSAENYVGRVPVGAIQQVLVDQQVEEPDHFLISACFASKSRMSVQILESALETVVSYHDMLRLRGRDGVFALEPYNKEMYHFEVFDLRNESDQNNARKAAMASAQKAVSLENGCLITVVLMKMREHDEIYLAVHHFVCDAVSLRIIGEDLFISYYLLDHKEAVRLPQKTSSYRDWVEQVNTICAGEAFAADRDVWKQKEEQIKRGMIPFASEKCHNLDYSVIEELTGLSNYAVKKQIRIDDIILSALIMAVGRKMNKDCVSVTLEGHGRYEELFEGQQVDRTVGWFTNMYPLSAKTEETISAQLEKVISEKSNIPNCGMGYLPYINSLHRADELIPQIAFNYLGESNESFSSIDEIRMITVDGVNDSSEHNRFLFNLSVNVMKIRENYEFHVVYDDMTWQPEIVESIISDAADIIRDELKNSEAAKAQVIDINERIDQIVSDAADIIAAYEKNMIENSGYTDFPLTGIQMISYDMGSRNAMIELKFYDKLDENRMKNVWKKIVNLYDSLRCSISLENDRFIRIYAEKDVQLPFLDISMYNADEKEQIVAEIVEKIDCYYIAEEYAVNKLASKALLVKLSPTVYKLLYSCSHMIFDRFSADVLKNKIMELYYSESDEFSKPERYSYENYYKLFCNEMAVADENELIQVLKLDQFKNTFDAFYEKNKDRELTTYVYRYENREKWEKLSEQQTLKIAELVFINGMKHVFPGTDIPVLALHIARKCEKLNLFDYMGEMLDVVPFVLPQDEVIEIEDIVQERYDFLQKNITYFSALMYFDQNHKYSKVYQMLNDIYEKMKKLIIVYNNTGVLKDANDIVFNSDKYRIEYNVMSVAVYQDGLFMNIAAEKSQFDELTQYLDELIEDMF